MTVQSFLQGVRMTLQDTDKNYWDDSELLFYYNDCRRNLYAERQENVTTANLVLTSGVNEYTTDGVLRYISATDNNGEERKLYPSGSTEDDDSGIIILDYNRVYVTNPDDSTSSTFKIIALPNDDNMHDKVRIGDESAMRYYVLSKAYEKETDQENFQKSNQFYQRYKNELDKLMSSSSANYRAKNTSTVKGYYY